MKKIGIISDTHSHIDERIAHHLKNCNEIWHAGDIGDIAVTDALNKIAPVRGVYGNIDGGVLRTVFPLNQFFEVEGMKVYMTHIAGKPGSYPARVSAEIRKFRPNIFVCGHSHICMVKQNPTFQLLHINPGAAGVQGFHKVRTLLRMDLDKGKVSNLEVVELGTR